MAGVGGSEWLLLTCFAAGSQSPLLKQKSTPKGALLFGAGERNRTPDLLITNELLYRLSYSGEG